MRWGVRDEMTNEHATTALCMNELRGCQKYSMGPNFIYFGAQKYGYRPIPSEIVTDELTKLIMSSKPWGMMSLYSRNGTEKTTIRYSFAHT